MGLLRAVRPGRVAAAASAASFAAAFALRDDTETSVARFGRSFYHAALVGYDYKFGPASKLQQGSEEYKAAKSATHQRAADRVLSVCLQHGGLYVKLGQFIASMNHVLPAEYPTTLTACQDRANAVGFEEIRKVVEEQLGCKIDEAFSDFSPTPIAAASLAQVHRATTTDGQPVACKVQYPKLPAQVAADMFTLRVLVKLLSRAFPDHEYTWLLPEFQQSITEELDFRCEAINGAETAANFHSEPLVHVPEVLTRLSGERVLTMEFIDGVKLTDADGLRELGLDGRDLAHLVSTAFSKMIFAHGLVHCDPHAGNLLARRQPLSSSSSGSSGKAQLVLLDHGMYRRLDEDFRHRYAQLWEALLTADHEAGRAAAAGLGVPESDYDALSLVLTFRPAGSALALGARITGEERTRLREKYGKLGAADVNAFLERLPRDMLFVMRTWSLVRSLNRALGGTTRQRLLVIAEHAAAGARYSSRGREGAARHERGVGSGGNRGGVRAVWARLRMRLLVRFVDYMGIATVTLAMTWVRLTSTVRQLLLSASSSASSVEAERAAGATPDGATTRLGARLAKAITPKGSAEPALRELG